MSMEPPMGESEQSLAAELNPIAPAADIATPAISDDSAKAAKAAEASKLFDKLFSNSDSEKQANTAVRSSTASAPAEAKKAQTGEDLIVEAGKDLANDVFHPVVKSAQDSTSGFPYLFVDKPIDIAATTIRKADGNIQPQNYSEAQDIPSSVDSVKSDTLKEGLLARAKALIFDGKPKVNFPERVSNIKTQHVKLRSRLANLERKK